MQVMRSENGVEFLQWALPRLGFRWSGFRKPRGQVLKRIRKRMEELGLAGGYDQYRDYLNENPQEWEHLDRLCYVSISKFLRDRKLWDFIRDELLCELMRADRPGQVAIWSVGCCNGEEPYGIAIMADQLSPNSAEAGNVSILATERNRELLERARRGRYPGGALKELSEQELKTYFRKTEDPEAQYEITGRLRRYIEFEERDIRASMPARRFDLVFCRNLVFTYFEHKEQTAFLRKLQPRIKPGGCLVIGSNEELPDARRLEQITGTHPVYRTTG